MHVLSEKPSYIGNDIKRIRMRHGMSQKDLAKKIGLSQSSISSYEVGDVIPRPTTIKRIEALIEKDLYSKRLI